jgi:hypothetical protein
VSIDFARAIYAKDKLVRVPIREKIRRHCDAQRDDHARRAADEITHSQEEAGHGSQEKTGTKIIAHGCLNTPKQRLDGNSHGSDQALPG